MGAVSKFNLDVFAELMTHFARPPELLNVSRTCRSLHRLATREVLRRGVYLSRPEQLGPFYLFMTSTLDDRAPLLHRLEIFLDRSPPLNVGDTCTLANLLRNCSIQILGLNVAPAMPLDRDSSVWQAISMLPDLRVLTLGYAGGIDAQNDLLGNLQTGSLVAVDIAYEPNFDVFSIARSSDGYDPTSTLRNYAATLKAVCLSFCWLRTFGSLVEARYPNITVLDLSHCAIASVDVLMDTFPNLRQLWMYESTVEPSLVDSANASSHVDPWKQLDYFEGTAFQARELRIPCPVRRWENSQSIECSVEGDIDDFTAFIATSRVARVSTTVELSHEDDLKRMIDAAERFELTHVSLTIEPQALPDRVVDKLPDMVVAFAKACKLVYLDLILRRDETIDHHASARRFFFEVPSLRFLALHLLKSGPPDISYWKRTTDVLAPRELSSEEFGAYQAAEGMDQPDFLGGYLA